MLLHPRPCSHGPGAVLALVFATGIGLATPSSAQPITWARWPMPFPRYDHVAVYDPPRHRMVVFGGVAPGPDGGDTSEMWSLSLDASPRWEWLGYTGSSPLARSSACAVYDPAFDPPNGRMVMFGGELGSTQLGDTWRLVLASDAWGQGFTGSPPAPGPSYAAVFDGLRRRMLVFGKEGGLASPVYQIDLDTDTWSAIETAGSPPTPVGPTDPYPVAYDVPRDRLIVRGLGGTWQLTLSGDPTWSQLVTAGTPPPNTEGDLFFDAPRDRMLQVRGDGGVWALSMDATPTWTSIANPPLPTLVHMAQIVHDPVQDRLIWFGTPNDTWAFDLATATWSLIEAGSPIPIRSRVTAVAVPPWDALVVFGGGSTTTYRFPLHGLGRFVEVAAGGVHPSLRYGAAGIYDPVRQRMIIFGGVDGQLRNDVHALSIGPTPTWSPIATAGTPPPPRQKADAIYDPIRDRMVIFGGDGPGSPISNPFNDVWALTLGDTPTWSQVTLDGALPEIRGQAVYDPDGDRLIAIGTDGSTTNGWWMPLGGPATWTAFSGSIGERYEFDAAFDPAGNRVLVYGGVRGTGRLSSDFYALKTSNGTWSIVNTNGEVPGPRYLHTLTRDPQRGRFVMYGGNESGPVVNLHTDAWPAHSVWFTAPSSPVDVGPPPTATPATLAFRRLWLAAPDRIAFELEAPGDGAVTIDVFDVAGRRRGATTFAATGAGPRSGTVVLAGAARSGIVLVRARQGALTAVRRLAVLR